jgi:LmbE family N-acetylglucosaminyl deacetylase
MISTLFRTFALGLAIVWSFAAQAQTNTDSKKAPPITVYITAHPDDWQLFMGADACVDVQRAGSKSVFICLTAGQAETPGDDFWKAREAGCQAAVQQAANLAKPAVEPAPTPETVTIQGHTVAAVHYRGTAAYFLRLPDGNLNGKGQNRGGFQSMRMLFTEGRSITTIDGSSRYATWDDLIQTVKAILQKEVGTGRVSMHAPQPDERYNPRDHSDHRMAGVVALATTSKVECRTLLYVGYDSYRRPANLQPAQAASQRSVYQAYSDMMVSRGQPSGWEPSHLQFIGRQYSQVRHQTGQQIGGQPEIVARPSTAGAEKVEDQPEETYTKLALEPNYPNPFDRSSLMAYQLPAANAVWLRVLDAQGREVMRLLNGEQQTAGRHEQWLDVNSFPAAGLYIAELRVGDERRTCRLQIIR